jgi:hypothetical protein
VDGYARWQVGEGSPDAGAVVLDPFDDAGFGPDPGEVRGVQAEVALDVTLGVGVAER